ncbi:CoA transferase [Variovorax paradoxus]|nr:CoA transferase [Variovorax paradoxus]MBT2302506.1 CoA transferase [Variovorax paradoxus]
MKPLPASTGPLQGIRVIDVTSTVVGPCATQILGDLGADVIRIEPPEGDQLRHLGPARHEGMAAMFLGLNRNKRSIVLDLKRGESKAALHRLLSKADVFVHNMRPKAAQRLGIAYADLAVDHPRLVYASASGYRPEGPLGNQPAFDEVIQGISGISALFQRGGDEARYAPFIIADKVVGYVLASSIGFALLERERSGRGQEVQVPMFETMVEFNLLEHFWGRAFDPPLAEPGYSRILTPERRPFRTRDGYVCVTATTDPQWGRLFACVGLPELAQDPRFGKMAQRSFHFREIFELLAQALATKTTTEWVAIFDAADLPNGPANTLEDLFDSEYLKEAGAFRTYEHPTEGSLVTGSPAVRYSRTPSDFRRPPPGLGAHTREVLREAGCTAEEIDALQRAPPLRPGPTQR